MKCTINLEYISKISEYDQKMYGEYEVYQAKLTKTKKNKQAKKDELVATKETLSFEKQSVKQLISKKKGPVDKIQQSDCGFGIFYQHV